MARILYITYKLNDHLISQAESLKNSGHDISILTSKNQQFTLSTTNQILMFFDKWSAWEWVKFVPTLFFIRPQLFHFVIDTETELLAQKLLMELAEQLKIPTSTHFINLSYLSSKKKDLRYFVEKSDLLTCSHRQTLIDLRGFVSKKKKQIKGVLPPYLNFRGIQNSMASEKKNFLSLLSRKKIFFPLDFTYFNADSLTRKIALFLVKYQTLVFVCDLNKISKSIKKKIDWELTQASHHNKGWIYYPAKTFADSLIEAKSEDLVFIAGLPLGIEDLTLIFEKVLTKNLKIILDEFQSQLFSGLWQNHKNCIILNQYFILKDLKQVIESQEIEYLNPVAQNIQQLKSEVTDISINEFNRLVDKVITQV